MITNEKLGDEWWDERKKVLAEWPTGAQVDFEEAVAFHKSLPPGRVWRRRVEEAQRKGETLIITGMGKTTLEQQTALLRAVEPVADVLGTSVDSLTRNHDFAGAAEGIEKSQKNDSSALNGFPVVNHGVAGIRRLTNALSRPVQLKYGAPDIRIISEIAYAGGYTADAADGLYNFWNMNAKASLETVLKNARYIHRLVGLYEERGVPLALSVLGMYGAGVPPGLVIAAALTQVLMMAAQGVKLINLHYMAQGNVAQDVAAGTIFRERARFWLDRVGCEDTGLVLTVGLALARYPDEPGCSFAVTAFDCLLARLCGAQLVDVRTISEAKTIPTANDIVVTYKAARMAANLFKDQGLCLDPRVLDEERRILGMEVDAIVTRVVELGEGDVAAGTLKAVETGVLDNPFSTHRSVHCRVLGLKDARGAVRYLEHGSVPLTREVLEFHRDKIAERETLHGRRAGYQMVVEDLTSISRGYVVDNVPASGPAGDRP
ncbi:MAG: hypothetical protein HY900_03695 [Deltaproteobacteria bacterium]|nr:hypothetical protein [Deltaproteobacteria bacterium]